MTARTRELPLIELRGTPRAQGRAHGAAARREIESNLELYFRRFALEGDVQPDEARRRGMLFLDVIDRTAPEYGEMVRGIAAGSGRPLADVAALNARYEILYSEFTRNVLELSAPPPGDGCTSFAVLPDAASDGHLRLGENWDWMPGVEGLMLRIEPDDGLRVLCFTEAGIAGGKIGLNSAGIGLAINGLVSSGDSWSRLKTPFHVRTWRVLNSRSLSEAVRHVLDEERSCSANFLIAHLDESGVASVVDVETSPEAAAQIDVRGTFAHANHFSDPDAIGLWQPLDERTSTFRRCDRLQRLMDSHAGALDDARLMALLADHEGFPQSVCAHPSPLWPEEEAYATVLGAIIDLTAGTMRVAPGNPCETPFATYALG